MILRLFFLLACLGIDVALVSYSQAAANLPVTSRAQMIATARKFAEHNWSSRAANLKAPCVRNYDTDWQPDQHIVGVPYKWGGVDSPAEFDQKLARGLAA